MADSKSNRKEPQFTVVMMVNNQAAEVEQNRRVRKLIEED